MVPTNLVVVESPSAVSRVTLVGFKGPTNSLRTLQIIPVAELSITKGMPSVSQENALSSLAGLAAVCARKYLAVVNTFICKVGISLGGLRLRRPYATKILSLHLLKNRFVIIPNQRRARPRMI